MTERYGIDEKLSDLGFQRDIAMKLVIGHVTIIGGISLRGFSLMFSEISPRTAIQYEVGGPISATKEMIGNLIRANLLLNHATSVAEWDALQYQLGRNCA